jgi:hypothetical protein
MSGFATGIVAIPELGPVEESLIRVADFPIDLPTGTEPHPLLDFQFRDVDPVNVSFTYRME